MSILDQIKDAITQALSRFAARKATEQAEGIQREAQGMLEDVQDFARRNPLGFGLLALLGAGLIWFSLRQRD